MSLRLRVVKSEAKALRRAFELQRELGFYDTTYLGECNLVEEKGKVPAVASKGQNLFDGDGRFVRRDETMPPARFGLEHDVDEFIPVEANPGGNEEPPDGPHLIERFYRCEFLSLETNIALLIVNLCIVKRTKEEEWVFHWESADRTRLDPDGKSYSVWDDCRIHDHRYDNVAPST